MEKNQRCFRRVSLPEAASVVFALVALLLILLFTYVLSRLNMLQSTEAQLGLLAALVVAVLGFVGFHRMAVRNSRLLEEAQRSASTLQAVVDDLKSTQAQLVRGETLRAMGQLSSGMAHHLNNLFAVILGRLELL